MKKALLYLSAAAFTAHFASAALAEDYGKAYDEMKRPDEMGMKSSMMGKHDMSGTVEAIDHKTGMMKVKTGVGALDVHFPPPTIKDLKPGDSITLHLGYTKGSEMMKK